MNRFSNYIGSLTEDISTIDVGVPSRVLQSVFSRGFPDEQTGPRGGRISRLTSQPWEVKSWEDVKKRMATSKSDFAGFALFVDGAVFGVVSANFDDLQSESNQAHAVLRAPAIGHKDAVDVVYRYYSSPSVRGDGSVSGDIRKIRGVFGSLIQTFVKDMGLKVTMKAITGEKALQEALEDAEAPIMTDAWKRKPIEAYEWAYNNPNKTFMFEGKTYYAQLDRVGKFIPGADQIEIDIARGFNGRGVSRGALTLVVDVNLKGGRVSGARLKHNS